MKVAVVGASGNAGTALLAALRDEVEVTEILGIARRRPDESADPYDAARWAQVDIAMPPPGPVEEGDLVARLAAELEGVDAVVHLAWLIQPNRERDLLRRANVDGTRRVVEACLKAGVPHLVCASSVGAYSAVDDDEPRDESWHTRGVRTSHYSVDKVAQERVLDEAEAAGLAVARVRPALVFDAEAGAEITRLFLGALVPPAALRPGTLPVMPWPAGMRLQVVHAADLADAYRRIVLRRATGAFNVATEPVLAAEDVADVVANGRVVPVPAAVLRPLISLAWRTRAVAADPGWLDMGMSVPVMDTSRARSELGWEPRHEAKETLRELLEGMAEGVGTASAPMRPREDWPTDQLPPGDVVPGGVVRPEPGSAAHRIPAEIDRDSLGLYLADHLTGATAGAERIERMAAAYAETELGPRLEEIAVEIREEREFLVELMASLELTRRRSREAAAWVSERASRVATSTRPGGDPWYLVLELELMRSAVMGKLGAWHTLAELAPQLGLPPEAFEALARLARDQAERFEAMHAEMMPGAFRRETSG